MENRIHYLWMTVAVLAIVIGGLVGRKAVEGDPVRYFWDSTSLGGETFSYHLFRVNTETGDCWQYAVTPGFGAVSIKSLAFNGKVVSPDGYSEEEKRIIYKHIPIEELSAP